MFQILGLNLPDKNQIRFCGCILVLGLQWRNLGRALDTDCTELIIARCPQMHQRKENLFTNYFWEPIWLNRLYPWTRRWTTLPGQRRSNRVGLHMCDESFTSKWKKEVGFLQQHLDNRSTLQINPRARSSDWKWKCLNVSQRFIFWSHCWNQGGWILVNYEQCSFHKQVKENQQTTAGPTSEGVIKVFGEKTGTLEWLFVVCVVI